MVKETQQGICYAVIITKATLLVGGHPGRVSPSMVESSGISCLLCGALRGIPRLENRETCVTRPLRRSRTVSAVRRATSRKAREKWRTPSYFGGC